MNLQNIITDFLGIKNRFGYEFQAQQLIEKHKVAILKNPKMLKRLYQENNLCFDYIEDQRMTELFEEMMKFQNNNKAKL